MLLLALSLLGGAYSLSGFSQLPPTVFLLGALLLAVTCWRFSKLRPLACFLLGAGFMGLSAAAQKSDQLHPDLQAKSLAFSAVVENFPVTEADSVRFIVRPVDREDLPQRIRLSWFQPDGIPEIGDTWRLNVRLKRPRGYANPDGFDFAGWLFRQGIGATGYVTGESGNYRIHGERAPVISGLRKRFVERVSAELPKDEATAVLMAIGVGARHEISRAQWDLYARTGTSHLMAISGLHIGLAATFAYFLCRGLFAACCGKRNLRDLATNGAMLAAMSYATVSGFAVPARRALLMAIVAGVLILLRRRMSTVRLLVIPCVLVFVTDPIAILEPGFQLSFAAVAILIFVAGQHVRVARMGIITGLNRLTRLQLALLTGLFPLTVLIFGRFALIAPAINMLVLPVFNFVTVPLALIGAMLAGPLDSTGRVLLEWAQQSIGGILWLVTIAGSAEMGSFQTRRLSTVFVIISLIPLVFVGLPPGWPGRKLALLAIIAVLVHRPAGPPDDCIDYHVLDVGQGLAIVLQTSGHALLFDTGPSFLNGSSTAELVVLPFLHRRGIDGLDKLIVSHSDLDHAGGVEAILAAVDVAEVMVGETLPRVDRLQRHCIAGNQWIWDAARFTILHPRNRAPWDRNNASCVLLVEVGEFRLLFTGDIESPAERLMVYRKSAGAMDVVIVPHHGSLTSSSESFVESSGPGLAIVSAGFQNRWRFPRPEIVDRWRNAGAKVLNTATMGAVSQRVCLDAPRDPVRLDRLAAQKFWHDVPSGRP